MLQVKEEREYNVEVVGQQKLFSLIYYSDKNICILGILQCSPEQSEVLKFSDQIT